MSLQHAGFVSIPPGREPGFDHADVFRARSAAEARVYVAHTGADRVEVIDCCTNTNARALSGHPGVAGVLVDSDQDLLFTSDRGCARVSVYRCSDETLLGQVGVGQRPNGLAYDPTRRRLFALNIGDPPGEHCTVSVVDLDQMAVVATIALPGRPRWAVYDAASDRVYANVQQPAQIVVLDAGRLQVVRTHDVPAVGPHGLSLRGERLFCAADGGVLVVLHRDTGAVLGEVALSGEPDVIMHDPLLARLYVAVGAPGVVDVVDDERVQLLETVPTEAGAHTLGWNPAARTLYAFLPTSGRAAVFVER